MKTLTKLLLAAAASTLTISVAQAADLRASPVVIEPLAGARTANFTLINEEDHPIKVQIRVMRWTMVDGKEVLTPTTDLVASPPLAALEAKRFGGAADIAVIFIELLEDVVAFVGFAGFEERGKLFTAWVDAA